MCTGWLWCFHTFVVRQPLPGTSGNPPCVQVTFWTLSTFSHQCALVEYDAFTPSWFVNNNKAVQTCQEPVGTIRAFRSLFELFQLFSPMCTGWIWCFHTFVVRQPRILIRWSDTSRYLTNYEGSMKNAHMPFYLCVHMYIVHRYILVFWQTTKKAATNRVCWFELGNPRR